MIAGPVLKDIAGGRRKSDRPEKAGEEAGVKVFPVFRDQVGSLVTPRDRGIGGRGMVEIEGASAVKVASVGSGKPVAVDEPPVLSSPVGESIPGKAAKVGAWAELTEGHGRSRPWRAAAAEGEEWLVFVGTVDVPSRRVCEAIGNGWEDFSCSSSGCGPKNSLEETSLVFAWFTFAWFFAWSMTVPVMSRWRPKELT